MDSPAGSVAACVGFVSAIAIPALSRPRAGPGVLVIRVSISGTCLHGQMRDLPGCLATHPTSRRSWHDGASGLPPVSQQRGRHHWNFRGSIAARSPVYASRPALPPCKTRFRLAGCAFAGRESNPLGCDEWRHPPFRPSPGAMRLFLFRRGVDKRPSIRMLSLNSCRNCPWIRESPT